MSKFDDDRLNREAGFHDKRIEGGEHDRSAQSKYYWVVQKYFNRLNTKIWNASKNARILELGCLGGDSTIGISQIAKEIVAIDISRQAVNHTNERIEALKIKNARAEVANAESLPFKTGEFDVVFGHGILHHLDLNKAIPDIARVLVENGQAFFREPLGYNPLINHYRKVTPNVRTADEHPLLLSDLNLIREYFVEEAEEFFGLTAIATAFLQTIPGASFVRHIANIFDDQLLKIPMLKKYAWQICLHLRKRESKSDAAKLIQRKAVSVQHHSTE